MAQKIVEIPGVGKIEFPDSMSDDEIANIIKSDQTIAAALKAEGAPGHTPYIGSPQGISPPVPLMTRFANALRQTARMAPTALGTLGGGIIGGTAGAPAGPAGAFLGGTTGAGIGAGLGQAALTGLQHLPEPIGGSESSIFGPPPSTASETLRHIARESNYGMVSEAAGRGIADVLPNLFKRALSPQVERELSILEREGVPYTAGDVRPGSAAQIVENLERGTLLGGKVMQDSDIAQAKALYAFKRRFLDSIGPLYSKEETGKMIEQAVETRSDQLFAKGGLFDKAYQRVAALFPARIDTAMIRGQIQPLRDEVAKLVSEGRIPSANSPDAPSKFMKLLDDMANYGTKTVNGPTGPQVVDVPLTYAEVWQDKQTIDSIIRSMGPDPLRSRAKAVIQKIHNILDDAMAQAADRIDPKAARMVRNINAGYKNAKELLETESLVAAMRNGRYNPEQIVGAFFKADRITPSKDLLRAIPPNQKSRLMPVIRRRVLENLFEPVTKESAQSGIEITSAKMLRTRFNAARDEMGIVFNPEQMKGIDDFISASQRAQMSGTMTNPASGRQLLAYGQIGSAIAMGHDGVVLMRGQDVGGRLLAEGVVVFGPKVLARALTNPRMARLLAKGFSIKATTAIKTGWTARVLNLMRMAEQQTKDRETPNPSGS